MRIAPAMLILVAVAPARAETTVRYTVLFQGKPSGEQITRTTDDGTVTVDYHYRNNGRGPDLKEQLRWRTMARCGDTRPQGNRLMAGRLKTHSYGGTGRPNGSRFPIRAARMDRNHRPTCRSTHHRKRSCGSSRPWHRSRLGSSRHCRPVRWRSRRCSTNTLNWRAKRAICHSMS